MVELALVIDAEELEGFETEEVKEQWKISDLSGADWAFRKLQEIDEDLEKSIEYAKREREKYDKFIKSEEETAERRKGYFKWKLEEYLRSQREHDPKFKLKTAQGTANYRNSKKWNYEDEKILNFLEKNELEQFIRVKKEVNKADLKKALKVADNGVVVTEDGEIVDGITVVDTETLSLKY